MIRLFIKIATVFTIVSTASREIDSNKVMFALSPNIITEIAEFIESNICTMVLIYVIEIFCVLIE